MPITREIKNSHETNLIEMKDIKDGRLYKVPSTGQVVCRLHSGTGFIVLAYSDKESETPLKGLSEFSASCTREVYPLPSGAGVVITQE